MLKSGLVTIRVASFLAGTFLAISAAVSSQEDAPQNEVFFGDLHTHTSYSDGSGTPREAYTYARDVAKLDFLAITEHNHNQAMGTDNVGIAADPSLYKGPGPEALMPVARDFNADGRFLALYGQEFSSMSRGNHVNVFDIGQVITAENGRFDQLLDFLKLNPDSSGQPPVMMLNHPGLNRRGAAVEYGRDDFGDEPQWVERMGAYAHLIEILNGSGPKGTNRPPNPTEDDYLQYLNLGFKLAPTACQDNHEKDWGSATTGRTAVIMPALTKANLMAALRNRHVYATEDSNLKLVVRVNGQLCGDVITPRPPAGKLKLDYWISDADDAAASYDFSVWRDAVGGPVAQAMPLLQSRPAGPGTAEIDYNGTPQYLYFKVVQTSTDGTVDRTWTAPVWLE